MWQTETITIHETLTNKEFMGLFAIFLGIIIVYNLVRILLFKLREETVRKTLEQLKKNRQQEAFMKKEKKEEELVEDASEFLDEDWDEDEDETGEIISSEDNTEDDDEDWDADSEFDVII